MKYNVFVKFLAVLLCTVCLFSAVAAGSSILVLTQKGLYNRTVDQMLEENIQNDGRLLAQQLASRYASVNLGGVPVEVVEQCFPSYRYHTFNGSYGYQLKSADGTVVDELTSPDPENAYHYSFPVSGQYIYLVSQQTETEKYPAIAGIDGAQVNTVMSDELYIYDAVPSEGAPVTQMIVTYEDKSTHHTDLGISLGTVYHTQDGQLLCMFNQPGDYIRENTTVTHMVLVSEDDLLYEASDPWGVGYFSYSSSGVYPVYVSTVTAEQVQETTPETVEETVSETVPETTAETVPETTVATEPPFVPAEVTDNVPASGIVEVNILMATLADGREVYHEDEYGLGRISREEGNVVFQAYEDWESENGAVVEIVMMDAEENVIFKASHADGIGELYSDDARLCFAAAIPEPPVVETTVETVPETVPETTSETVPETTEPVTVPTEPESTRPAVINGKSLEEYDIQTQVYFDPQRQQNIHVEYVYTPMEEYTLELYLTDGSFRYGQSYELLRLVRQFRSYLLPVLGASLGLFLVLLVYLLLAAGRKPKTEERQAGGLNRIPLDLYLVIVGLGIPCMLALLMEGTPQFLEQSLSVGCAFGAGTGVAACLLLLGLMMAMAAQFKTPDGFWWKNLLCVRFIRGCFLATLWLERKGKDHFLPFLGGVGTGLWLVCSKGLVWFYRTTEKILLRSGDLLGRFFRWLKAVIHRFLCLLPLTWQWLVAGMLMFLLVAVSFAANGEEVLVVLALGVSTFLIVYGAHCFGTLLDSTKKMRKGNLNTKVDDKMMVGAFKEFAGELNELAGVAVVAAQKQLNSERMKSELITNVSHDIKTPLTSIINYTDLLQKAVTQEEREQYLEVISRQSLQLKKLLEDLMDMSKASTGNMNVEITCLDAVEAVNQALGEFADKLEKVRLTPVVRHSEEYVPMMADGRLVWRVLSNLLGNVVKYAMPGTRLYLDVMTLDDSVVISMKNISREELNVDAEELMERFVRGDDSRNTEGSGLGLNIAKSLTELQKGQMQLLVDGDLFKVTLIFPKG